MTICEYIQNHIFQQRANEHGSLVIYDASRRYRDIALNMASDRCHVIDASKSVIEQREVAVDSLITLAEGQIQQLIIWIPANPPEDGEAKQRDPFSVFAEVGSVFPQGDGDSYISICRRAKPDYIPEINRLFEEGPPAFEMVDALDQGGSWPKLKTLLNASSLKEIILGILSPKAEQESALRKDPTWVGEAKDVIQRSLGHKFKTKGQTRESIAEELWRVLLFSEFVFDSEGNVAKSLGTVPRADINAKGLVYEVCDELRKHQDHRGTYLENAKQVEEELKLADQSEEYTPSGDRDTFAFEERFFLRRVVALALAGHIEQAKEILNSRKTSIWLADEDRLLEWSLAGRAVNLLQTVSGETIPKFTSLESMIQSYALTWRELDRYHREMEQAFHESKADHEGLEQLVMLARTEYFRCVEALQVQFISLVAQEGWPVAGSHLIWNSQIFSKLLVPSLESGKRVAFFLVDSLRYELGAEIEKQLSNKFKVTLRPVCAQLPTYTEVGMASLMPDAESELKLVIKDGKLVSTLGGTFATTPPTRLAYVQSRKGDQCEDAELEIIIGQKKPKISDKIKLLLIKTRDIDTIAHGSPHQALEMIPSLLRQIIRGLHKLAELGFDEAVIATDHGFILVHEQAAGNVAPKPPGKWFNEKDRCLLGQGQKDSANLVMKATDLGIRGEFEDFACPKALVAYSRGHKYFHEGISLQECVLPCLTVDLGTSKSKAKKSPLPSLMLTYRQGKMDRVTSRRPVLDLTWPQGEIFSEENEIEVLVEAVDSKGKVVGSVSSGQAVNPATGSVRIKPGASIPVALKMDDDFSGSFTVRVLDSSNIQIAEELKLKTGYIE